MSATEEILIVDGEASFRELLGRFLGGFGFQTWLSATGEEGLIVARTRQPRIIVLHLGLRAPGLSGESTLIALKADPRTRRIPVIAVSSFRETPEVELAANSAGADSFLIKSELVDYEFRPLLRQVQALVNAQRLAAMHRFPHTPGPMGIVFTVLVIDDEEDTVERLRYLFLDQPYRFLWTPSGHRGLQIAASELPDLVVLDLSMPGMDGEEVCRALRGSERFFPIPILVMTSDERVREEARMLDLGADDYVLKSAPPSRIMARIRGLIRRKRFGASSKGIESGGVFLDTSLRRLRLPAGESIALDDDEASLLVYLMSACGRLLEEGALAKKLSCAGRDPNRDSLRRRIDALRRKLEDFGGLIQSEGDGYRFNLEYARRLRD